MLTSLLLLSGLTIFQKRDIENRLLENNLAYARKLADTTDRYLATAQRELAYSASKLLIARLMNNEEISEEAQQEMANEADIDTQRIDDIATFLNQWGNE